MKTIILTLLAAASMAQAGLLETVWVRRGAVDTDLYFFSTGHNSAWQAPFTTGTVNNVTWYNPVGQSTNAFAPPIAFFTNAGTYRISCPDWSKVTRLSFYAGADSTTRNYLTNIANSAVTMARLKDVTTMSEMFRQQTNLSVNISSWPLELFTKNTSMYLAFYDCAGLTGAIPDISTMTKNTSMYAVFYNCRGLTGSIPNISTMTNNTSMAYTFSYCRGLTGSIPNISTMTNNTSMEYAFYNCTGLTGSTETIFYNTNNFTKIKTSANAFAGVVGLTGSGMRWVNAQKAASYTVGTASTNSSYRTFYGCTNLSDYATIPAEYK